MCRKCSQRYNYWGHPLGRKIWPREYETEKTEVEAILSLNADHPGIIGALEWCEKFLDRAGQGIPQVPSSDKYLSILADMDCTPLEVLTEAAAMELLYQRGSLIKTKRHLINTTGRKILKLRRYRCPSHGKQHRETGVYVRRGIGEVLLLNISKSCNKREEKIRERLQKQGLELRIE
jgi:hypothetical protein